MAERTFQPYDDFDDEPEKPRFRLWSAVWWVVGTLCVMFLVWFFLFEDGVDRILDAWHHRNGEAHTPPAASAPVIPERAPTPQAPPAAAASEPETPPVAAPVRSAPRRSQSLPSGIEISPGGYRHVYRQLGPEEGRCRLYFSAGAYQQPEKDRIYAELCPGHNPEDADLYHVDTLR